MKRAGRRMFVRLVLAACLTLAFPHYGYADVSALTAELDCAQELQDYARLAAQFELLGAGGDERCAALTQLARAYYLMGEAEPDGKRREGYLDKALDASDKALNIEPGNTVALYWRCMALLQKADINGGLSALGMVKRALRGFESVEAAEPGYDGAGAYRSHGKVLMEAPAWAFIGDKDKGVKLLEKAKAIAPGSLINRLYLAEAYAETGRRAEAVRELEYIADAPVGPLKPTDDVKTKDDASKLLERLSHGGR